MKTSCQWLTDFLAAVPPAREAGEILTMGGFPVEEFDHVDGVDVMDVEITSNRPDLLSHVGIARELAALAGGSFKRDEAAPKEVADRADATASVTIERPDLCPHYTARILRNVKIAPSPEWMQKRLEQIGLRPINNVVDVTNYVLFELGQPLHAFDFDQLAGGRIVVRNAREGETLKTLDGMERRLTPDMLVIADAETPAALAGVMGGERSEVTGATTNILLESARFDPLNVRNTSRRLKLMSDSSYRFERGLDPTLAVRAAARAAELILETAGGELLSGYAEAGSGAYEPKQITLRWSELRRLLGVDLPHDAVTDALARLGLSPREVDGGLETTVPSHRLDLSIEADLIEEAARVVGYDKIPLRESITVQVKGQDPALQATGVIRDALVAAGYFEAVTFSFVSDALSKAFVAEGTALRRVDTNVRKADGHLRPSVLPGLVEAIRYNESVGNGPAKVFETGSAFWRDNDGPQEQRRLAFAGGTDYADCRGAVELVLQRLDATRSIRVEPHDAAGFGKGACGRVLWDGHAIGHVGLLAQDVVEALDLRHRPAIAELDVDALVAGYRPVPENKPLARFPSARRDVSLVVKDRVAYSDLADLVTEMKLADVVGVDHGGTYRGKPLAKGTKSVTLTLVFRRESGTVPREAADAEIERLVTSARERFGAEVRT